jgi:predicted  nucleic acid-binding Zn-ribbon protein
MMTDDTALHALLEVQAHDTRLDQLRHQLAGLPERTQRDEAAEAVSAVEGRIAAATAERDELARQQKRIDDEVELLKEKRTGFDQKLYGGTVSNPRELQDLQDEIDSLSRRITQLEDDELEVMEQVEPVEAQLSALAADLEAARAALVDAEVRYATAASELEAATAAEEQVRAGAIEPVPADLLAQYERLRGGLGGVGIARLVGSQCGGCHLGLSAMEVARIRKLPAGEIAHCEECGRILVP